MLTRRLRKKAKELSVFGLLKNVTNGCISVYCLASQLVLCAVLALLLIFMSGTALASDKFKQEALAEIKSLQQAHSYQKARHANLVLLARYPKDPEIHLAYARLLAEMGLIQESIGEYRQALRLNGNLAEAFIALSELYLHNLDPYISLGYAQLAVKSAPQSKDARVALIASLIASERLHEADEEICALVKDQGTDADVLILRYQLERKHGDLTAAKTYLESALRHNANRVDWFLELAQIEEALGDFAQAQKTLRKVLSIAPDSLEGRRRLAINLEFFFQDYKAAINEYKRLLAVDPSSVSASAGIDRCQRKTNDLAFVLKQAIYNTLIELARWLTSSSAHRT